MKKVHILLVEDNEGDIMLTKEAFSEGSLLNEMSVVSDGEQALDFLYKREAFTEVTRPDLILMDINIPRLSGIEILDIIKHDDMLKSIPVVMLTTSSAGKDILEAYRNYANCYIVKPIDFTKFSEAVKEIEDFWFSLVTLA